MGIPPLSYQVAPVCTTQPGPHPALILLHGRGADENDLLSLAPYFDPQFFIAAVRAPYQFPYGGFTWFDLELSGAIDIDQLLESQEALFQCLDTFQKSYYIDPSRIFLFGFSMGAMMALTISLSRPKLFKGIVAHSGLLPQHDRLTYQWDDLCAISYFIAHGEYDPVVPVALGRNSHKQLSDLKVNVEYREYPIQHAISEESLHDIADWLCQHI
jgi:phospholipase/carboxylesterase